MKEYEIKVLFWDKDQKEVYKLVYNFIAEMSKIEEPITLCSMTLKDHNKSYIK